MKDIILLGSGGFAREVVWLLEENNKVKPEWNILGYLSEEPVGKEVGSYPVIGKDAWLLNRGRETYAVCCVGDGSQRKRIVEQFKGNSNVIFPNIISRDVVIAESVKLGVGNIIAKSSILTVDIKLGNFNIINLDSTIGHDCQIGNFVTINPGAHISGNVTLCDGVTIGTGATCIQGITVNENTTVGAGAAVVRDLEPNVVAVGIPAKALKGKNNE